MPDGSGLLAAPAMGPPETVDLPAKLVPIFDGVADVRGAYGGRGSGKTRSFALMSAIRVLMWDAMGREGIVLCARQFMNSLDDSSMEEVKLAIQAHPWLARHFVIGEKFIRTVSGRIRYKFAGLDRSIDAIKSKARILLCWVDEAEPVLEVAWAKLIPTLREEDSELWVTWNPELKGSDTDKRFRQTTSPRMKIVRLNWRDNPWFPRKLNRDRLDDQALRPDHYDHVWEGAYRTAYEGAYYARWVSAAKTEGRIGFLPTHALTRFHLFHDLAGTGDKADFFVSIPMQFVGAETRVLDCSMAQGQPYEAHIEWMRRQGYEPHNSVIILPHDGDQHEKIHAITPASYFEGQGYTVEVIPNQGKGAALRRIDAGRLLFPSCRFDEDTCQDLLLALASYHEKRDPKLKVGLGPSHDQFSHPADAFGLAAVWRQMNPSSFGLPRARPRRRTSAWTA